MLDMPLEPLPDEPARRRHEIALNRREPQPWGQEMKELGRLRQQHRLPTIADPRERAQRTAPDGARDRTSLVVQGPATAGDEADFHPGFMQQYRELGGRGAAAEDRHVA